MTSSTPAPAASPPATSAPRSETSTAEAEEERHPELPAEPGPEPEAKAATDTETEEEKARRLLYCSLCKVAVNSASQLEAHNSGKRHAGAGMHGRSDVLARLLFTDPGLKGTFKSMKMKRVLHLARRYGPPGLDLLKFLWF